MAETEQIKTNLEFKDHRDFFEDYNTFRKRAFILLSECITDNKKLSMLYETTITLIDFTSNYIPNIEEIDKLLNDIDYLFSSTKQLEINKKLIINKFRELLRLINYNHELSNILPQKSSNYDKNQKFWRDEESVAMREMKKAFYDVFMKK